jgi:hypothetical protein
VAAFAVRGSKMDFLRLRRHRRQRLAIAGELRASDPMARLLLFSVNRDRLNDENGFRFHPFPSVCAETCRARASVSGA